MSFNNTCGLEESLVLASLTDPHEATNSTEQLDGTAEVDQEHADLMVRSLQLCQNPRLT